MLNEYEFGPRLDGPPDMTFCFTSPMPRGTAAGRVRYTASLPGRPPEAAGTTYAPPSAVAGVDSLPPGWGFRKAITPSDEVATGPSVPSTVPLGGMTAGMPEQSGAG